jgi:hypothetical protein
MSETERRSETSIPPHASPKIEDKSTLVPPQAFLSYAWESDQHKIWVQKFAERLYGDGVETILDYWGLPPGSDRPVFMERSIEQCRFVIVICTPTYAQKANSREGGVGYESMVLTAELAKKIDSRKIIPVLRSGDWSSSLPAYLQTKHGVNLRGDPYDEGEYEQLIRTLHGEPVRHPPLGPKPQFAARPAAATTYQGLIQQPGREAHEAKATRVKWDAGYPGPCIDVAVTNSRHVVEARPDIGLEYPEPFKMKALLDTGAAVTVISRTFAMHCKLYQTGVTEIKTLGALQKCGEHAGAISFPGTSLRPIDPIRIISADFIKEPYHACLIGWDILRNWKITFDGRANCVTISD